MLRATGPLAVLLLAACLSPPVADSSVPAPEWSFHETSPERLAQVNLSRHVGERFSVTGFVHVSHGCLIPEGCGPKLRIYERDQGFYLPLLGYVAPSEAERLVTLAGLLEPRVVRLMPWGEKEVDSEDRDYQGPRFSLRLQSLAKLGDFRLYNETLLRSEDLIKQRYGCRFAHDKSYGFTEHDRTLQSFVRWTYYDQETLGNEPERFVEFRLHPQDGRLLGTVDRLGSFPGCWRG